MISTRSPHRQPAGIHKAAETASGGRSMRQPWVRIALLVGIAFAIAGHSAGAELLRETLVDDSPNPPAFRQELAVVPEKSRPATSTIQSWLGMATTYRPPIEEAVVVRRAKRMQALANVSARTFAPSTAAAHASSQSQLIESLRVSGSPSEGNIVTFRNGKAVWEDLPSNILHGSSDGRTSGGTSRPTDSGGSARRGGGGSGGGSDAGSSGGGTTNVTNITTTTGLDQTAADALYVNLTGDTMTGDLSVVGNLSGSTFTVSSLQSCDTIDTDATGNFICAVTPSVPASSRRARRTSGTSSGRARQFPAGS